MTSQQALALYEYAGGGKGHLASEYPTIQAEMQAVVNAPTVEEAAKVIGQWGCWEGRYTAVAFALRVRRWWRTQQ